MVQKVFFVESGLFSAPYSFHLKKGTHVIFIGSCFIKCQSSRLINQCQTWISDRVITSSQELGNRGVNTMNETL